MLETTPIPLDEAGEAAVKQYIRTELDNALAAHEEREQKLAEFLRAYKAIPRVPVKNFPWKNASNVVVPLVAIAVDNVSARLQRAMLAAKDPVEAHVTTTTPFQMANGQPLDDNAVREWAKHFLESSGAREQLRAVFFDMPLWGDAFVKPLWVEEEETYHAYGPANDVVQVPVPGYKGVKWFVTAPADVIWPTGFDSWSQLPWFGERLRWTWVEIMDMFKKGMFTKPDITGLKSYKKTREDKRQQEVREAEGLIVDSQDLYEVYQFFIKLEIPPKEGSEDEPTYEEAIIIYSRDADMLLRAVYNPYFGKARHFVKIPYLLQAHEVPAIGVAEQALPLQEEASTAHNQVIDAATAANAGIIAVSPETNIAGNEEIYPGKKIVTPNPSKDIAIYHLSDPSRALSSVEQQASMLVEKRTGVSIYNMGIESATVGSRATATGTTALISEGNQRFWVSIDDMRHAIEELLYLTIQQFQQMLPEGYEWAPGKYIQFPPGDPRLTVGLKLTLTSESVNRDLEIQNLQLLMTVLNDYYQKLMQAGAVILNPQFPPPQKALAIEVMNASGIIIKKFVERFDIENIDAVVPTILQAMQAMSQVMTGGMNGAPGMVGTTGGGAPGGPAALPGGPGGPTLPAPAGNGNGGGAPLAGGPPVRA